MIRKKCDLNTNNTIAAQWQVSICKRDSCSFICLNNTWSFELIWYVASRQVLNSLLTNTKTIVPKNYAFIFCKNIKNKYIYITLFTLLVCGGAVSVSSYRSGISLYSIDSSIVVSMPVSLTFRSDRRDCYRSSCLWLHSF